MRRPALLYLALTLLLTYPLSVKPATTILPLGPDASLFLWTLAWDAHAFVQQPWAIFDANIYHPMRHTLAYSENVIGSALFAAPVIWVTDNPVLAMNAVALLSCVLCGLGTYVLARRIGIGAPGAIVSGIIFAFSPPRLFRLGQLHLTAVQWLPFGLASLHAYLDGPTSGSGATSRLRALALRRGSPKPSAEAARLAEAIGGGGGRPRDLRLAAAFFTLQALSSGHGAVFAAVAMAGLVVYRVARGKPAKGAAPDVPQRQRLVERYWFLRAPRAVAFGKRLRDLGVPGLLLLVPTALIWLPYRTVQTEMGLRRTLESWAVTPISYLASPAHVPAFLLSLVSDVNVAETANAYLFPGILPVLLAMLAFRFGDVRMWGFGDVKSSHSQILTSSHSTTLFYVLLTLLAIWLSLGPPIGLWPLVYWLPGFSFIRVPSRFTILALLGLAVLAGIGVDRASRRLAAPRQIVLATVISALLVAEFAAIPLYVDPYRLEIPAADRWLDDQPKPFAIAEVPLPHPENAGAFERRQTAYMLHSTAHWQKTVHGYSGLRPPLHEELYEELLTFPDDRSLRRLTELGVRYIVVHTELYPPGEWEKAQERVRTFPVLTLEHIAGSGRVYRIVNAR